MGSLQTVVVLGSAFISGVQTAKEKIILPHSVPTLKPTAALMDSSTPLGVHVRAHLHTLGARVGMNPPECLDLHMHKSSVLHLRQAGD